MSDAIVNVLREKKFANPNTIAKAVGMKRREVLWRLVHDTRCRRVENGLVVGSGKSNINVWTLV